MLRSLLVRSRANRRPTFGPALPRSSSTTGSATSTSSSSPSTSSPDVVARSSAVAALLAVAGGATLLLGGARSSVDADARSSVKTTTTTTTTAAIIETDLMDRIANKPYLRYRDDDGGRRRRRRSGRDEDDDDDKEDATSAVARLFGGRDRVSARPEGVPERTRVLVVDVPEFRRVFDEECVADLSKIFPDGVARPHVVKKEYHPAAETPTDVDGEDDGERSRKTVDVHVVQKSLAKSLAVCGERGKTVLLEASVRNINPRNMKRRYSFHVPQRQRQRRTRSSEDGDEGGNETGRSDENNEKDPVEPPPPSPSSESETSSWDDELRDEEDAPWNQKAWLEEMELRIHGKVPFSSSMEPSSELSRFVFGNHYRTTVPASSLPWYQRLLLLPFLSPDPSPDGAPGRASHRPHAVLANGATMHAVPGSLHHLTRSCRDADVPLYVVNDPRRYRRRRPRRDDDDDDRRPLGTGGDDDVFAAARDARREIKRRVVREASARRRNGAFARGRAVGRAEVRVANAARDAVGRTRRAAESLRERTRRTTTTEEEDWSGHEEDELREELVKRRAIATREEPGAEKETSANDDVNDSGGGGARPKKTVLVPSKGMLELCKSVLGTVDDSDANPNANGKEDTK